MAGSTRRSGRYLAVPTRPWSLSNESVRPGNLAKASSGTCSDRRASVKLKPGMRLRSQVDTTEVIVVRSSADDIELACGGQPMIDVAAEPKPDLAPAGDPAEGTQRSSCSSPSRASTA